MLGTTIPPAGRRAHRYVRIGTEGWKEEHAVGEREGRKEHIRRSDAEGKEMNVLSVDSEQKGK